MHSIVILQARTSSSRLPAKVLLPINGIPLVVLAAKRAANAGREILVLISEDDSDDGLAYTLNQWKLNYFRGSLDSPLERIVAALEHLNNETIVFRLTADNVFPDGKLLDELETEFKARNLNYLCCNGESSGLPYGVSVEVTFLKHLRNAYEQASSMEEHEHVTPFIIKKFGRQYFEKYRRMNKGHLRCTVDFSDDYTKIQRLFLNIGDPINISFLDLVRNLELLTDKETDNNKDHKSGHIKELVLGSAQFGGSYGINNKTGQPNLEECRKILKTAIDRDIVYIDTARAYGESEEMIGKILPYEQDKKIKIITKLSPLSDLNNFSENTEKSILSAFVDASIYQSCWALNRKKLDAVLLHRAEHIDVFGGYIWDKLLKFKDIGLIQDLGVSVQSPIELERVVSESEISYIQLPFNILDNRWKSCLFHLKKQKLKRELKIHVRSVFLQGLLLSDDGYLWRRTGLDNYADVIKWLELNVRRFKRENMADLCLAYVRSQPWIDGIVIGMERHIQLIENINYFSNPILASDELRKIETERPSLPESFLNPSMWH